MIDLDEWLKGLDEEDDREVRDNEEYQRKLFSEYVLRKNDKFSAKRAELAERFDQRGTVDRTGWTAAGTGGI